MASTWQQRVRACLPENGYEACMRRSLQTVILYEARRCLVDKFSSMRPFQRKGAFLDQCHALIESLDFIPAHFRAEIFWRTASSKEPMDAEIAWKRVKSIEKELETLASKLQPFSTPENSHQEAVDILVQDLFETLTGATGKPRPANWEHAHNHVIFCLRVYYAKEVQDRDFPAAISPRQVVVPSERPPSSEIKKQPRQILPQPQLQLQPAGMVPAGIFPATAAAVAAAAVGSPAATFATPPTAMQHLSTAVPPADDRMTLLLEVRQHLDLLKEFEGVISTEDLAQRKRELFLALPPAPPDASKRMKHEPTVV